MITLFIKYIVRQSWNARCARSGAMQDHGKKNNLDRKYKHIYLRSVHVAEWLTLPTSVHGVAGSNPAGGEILPEPKRRFIAQSLSCSSFHRLEMTEILLKGRKTLTHPSIHIYLIKLRVSPKGVAQYTMNQNCLSVNNPKANTEFRFKKLSSRHSQEFETES